MKNVITLLFLLFQFFGVRAQIHTLTGSVIDGETSQPIPYAHVFLSGTTLVTISDEAGNFYLKNIPAGNYQLAASFIGYEFYTKAIRVGTAIQNITLKLNPQVHALENVLITSSEDKAWNKNLRAFKKVFLGSTQNSKACQIVNPWVLEFDKKGANLIAKAAEPLEVLNKSLGYRILFHLKHFEASPEKYSIVGPTEFQEIEGSDNKEVLEQNRKITFGGSTKHFLQSLQNDEFKNSGFRIFQSTTSNKNEERSLYFEKDIDVRVHEIAKNSLLRRELSGTVLAIKKPLEVHYEFGHDDHPKYKDLLHQVSWIQSTSGIVKFDSLGNIMNPSDIIVAGFWNEQRVADLLPTNYKPLQGAGLNLPNGFNLEVMTNSDIYQSGSTLWYSARGLNSIALSSQVISVRTELVDSTNKIIDQRLDPNEGGSVNGFFSLPDDLKGTYFLRSYTCEMYNNGQVYLKPIAIVPKGYGLNCSGTFSTLRPEDIRLELVKVNGSNEVNLWLIDNHSDTVGGNFIVSISIENNRFVEFAGKSVSFTPPITKNQESFKGVVTNSNGKRLSGTLTFTSSNLKYSIDSHVELRNGFVLNNVEMYDSTQWLVQFRNQKNKPVSHFKIIWDTLQTNPEIPFLLWPVKYQLTQVEESTNDYLKVSLPDSVKLLNEVIIKGKSFAKQQPVFRSFGSPQYILEGKELASNPASTNILATLSGRFPGLITSEAGLSNEQAVNFSIRGPSSFTSDERPTILLDGMPLENIQFAYSLLQSIPLTEVDRVEVRTGLSPLQGLKGGNGIIAVYTKKTFQSTVLKNTEITNPYVQKISLRGYSRTKNFIQSNGSENLYWNPNYTFEVPKPLIIHNATSRGLYISLYGVKSDGSPLELHQKFYITN